MLKNARRKIANSISPEKSHSYPFVELNWADPIDENRRGLERAYKNFYTEFGRPAASHAEAWQWDREQLNITLVDKLGLEPARTDFVYSYFFRNEEEERDMIRRMLNEL